MSGSVTHAWLGTQLQLTRPLNLGGHPKGGNMATETWEGSFYCVKCKEKRDAKGEVVVNDKGTKMA